MMLAKAESGKKTGGDERFLHDIEAIGQALYLNRNPSKGLVSSTSDARSKSAGKTHFPEPKPKSRTIREDLAQKEKKPSIWNWKPLKALSHIRNRRFNCCFTLQVHSVEGLPSNFNDSSVCVHWKRRDDSLQTRRSKVIQGRAEFEETLMHKCSVYGSGNGPNHSAKYEARHFLLYVSVVGSLDLDLGKHRMDLTRLLPLTLEELEEEKSSGKWTTSYKLTGKAKGATLNVSFGFTVVRDDQTESRSNRMIAPPLPMNVKQNKPVVTRAVMGFNTGENPGNLRRAESLSDIHTPKLHHPSQSVDDVKILHEVLPSSKSELSSSISSLYEKFNDENVDASVDSKPVFEAFAEQQVETLKPNPCSLPELEKEKSEDECEDTEFTVIEKGIEMPTEDHAKDTVLAADVVSDVEIHELDEMIKAADKSIEEDTEPESKHEDYGDYGKDLLGESDSKENNMFTKESIMEELDAAFQSLSMFESAGMESPSPQCKSEFLGGGDYTEVKSNYKASKVGKSLSLDDATDSVASEFLSMLGLEHSPFGLSSDSDPESPRERLLRQFERDSLAGGNCIFGFDMGKEEEVDFAYDAQPEPAWGESSHDFELSSVFQAAEAEHLRAAETTKAKTRAKMLEDLETEALMREWGMNEKAFQRSPPGSAGGFGSPIDLPPEPFELPPLGDGLGPFVQTKDGGFLRSMNPSLFRNAKNVGNLIMQVSSPVVVPAEMGSGIMEILQGLAAVGIEKLSMQASKLMPLEDITGKTMQQVAWEAAPSLEAAESQVLVQHEPEFGLEAPNRKRKGKGGFSGHRSGNGNLSSSRDAGSEYVSLEDLAPLAMDKIEALSIEGLRIQSGMSDEEAPSNISPQSIGDMSAFEGKRGANLNGSIGLEGTGGLQLMDIKDSGNDVDGLMGLSITLDEWMRLDAGIVDDEDEISERTSKILAAHHACSTDLFSKGLKGDKKKGKSKKCGLLGNNFTVALMVQLRDPLRNYEPVGTPMLSLIQVERVFRPPKPKIYSTVSERRITEDDEESEPVAKDTAIEIKEEKKEEVQEEVIPQFKITEVHVAGLKTEPGKKKLWGNSSQQQSGSRWLLASGMGKSNKHPLMKGKNVSKSSSQPAKSTTTVQPGETLWSISSRVHGTGEKWKDLAALNPHIRNPNVIFPNETIRLR